MEQVRTRSPRRRTEDKKRSAVKNAMLVRRFLQKDRTRALRRWRNHKAHQQLLGLDDEVNDDVDDDKNMQLATIEPWTMLEEESPPAPSLWRRVWSFLANFKLHSV